MGIPTDHKKNATVVVSHSFSGFRSSVAVNHKIIKAHNIP